MWKTTATQTLKHYGLVKKTDRMHEPAHSKKHLNARGGFNWFETKIAVIFFGKPLAGMLFLPGTKQKLLFINSSFYLCAVPRTIGYSVSEYLASTK